jgi:xylose isomerase
VNLHDNDLVPIDASAHERDQIVSDFRKALDATDWSCRWRPPTCSATRCFRDGRFTANDPGSGYAPAEDDARDRPGRGARRDDVRVLGWREGVETDPPRTRWSRSSGTGTAMNFLCAYVKDQGYDLRFRAGVQANEPRRHLPARRPARCSRSSQTSSTRRWWA